MGALFSKSMGLVEYIKETRAEMSHVSWPTRRQVVSYTAVVIILSIVTSAYLGAFDFILRIVLGEVLTK